VPETKTKKKIFSSSARQTRPKKKVEFNIPAFRNLKISLLKEKVLWLRRKKNHKPLFKSLCLVFPRDHKRFKTRSLKCPCPARDCRCRPVVE